MKEAIQKVWGDERLFLAVALMFALAVRLLYISQLHGLYRSDAQSYDAIAVNLVNGLGFTDGTLMARRPPLFPYFLALIYMVFGHDYMVVRIIQAIIGTLTCLNIYLIGKQVIGKDVGKIALLIASIYPFLVYYTGALLTENIFTFLLSLSVLQLLKFREKPDLRNAAFAGGFLGLAALTRPVILAFPVFLLFWLVIAFENVRRVIIGFVIILVFMGLTIMPWTIRNYFVFHQFVPIQTHGGQDFWYYNKVFSYNDLKVPEGELIDNNLEAKNLSEAALDRYYWKKGIEDIMAAPSNYVKACVRKLIHFWRPFPQTGFTSIVTRKEQILSLLSYGLLLPLSFTGFIASLRNKTALLMHFLILYFTFVSTFILYGSSRFRFPISPYIILFAGFAFERFLKRMNLLC